MGHVAKTEDIDNRKLVRKDDYVINSRSDRRGSGGVSSYDGCVSLINIVLTPRDNHPKYLHYLMRSHAFQEEFYRYGHGIVADLWTTRFSEMKSIEVGLPTIPEQVVIASHLEKIDAYLAMKERHLALLQQKRTSLVNSLVRGHIQLAAGTKK